MAITLCFQLCSAFYTALQMTSALNLVTTENQMIPVTVYKHREATSHSTTTNQHLALSEKILGHTGKAKTMSRKTGDHNLSCYQATHV